MDVSTTETAKAANAVMPRYESNILSAISKYDIIDVLSGIATLYFTVKSMQSLSKSLTSCRDFRKSSKRNSVTVNIQEAIRDRAVFSTAKNLLGVAISALISNRNNAKVKGVFNKGKERLGKAWDYTWNHKATKAVRSYTCNNKGADTVANIWKKLCAERPNNKVLNFVHNEVCVALQLGSKHICNEQRTSNTKEPKAPESEPVTADPTVEDEEL